MATKNKSGKARAKRNGGEPPEAAGRILNQGPAHWDEILHREFQGESDRACVILGAAVLDSALETLLRSFFVPPSSADDPLFDGANAPLATFSARVEMAYRADLIDAAFARNLHLVRRIRNDFAHNVIGCTFGDSAVVSRMTELRRSTGLPEGEQEIRRLLPDGPRGDFQMIVSWLQWVLRSLNEHVIPVHHHVTLPGNYLEYVGWGTTDAHEEQEGDEP